MRSDQDISHVGELEAKAENIVRQVAEGDIDIFQHDFGNYIDANAYEFDDWINNLEAYISEIEEAPSEEEKIEILKGYISDLSIDRAKQLINEPDLICEDELLEWKRKWLKVTSNSDCDLLVLIPFELDSGAKASVAIICYTNIPGGESSLVETFETLKEGEEFFARYTI